MWPSQVNDLGQFKVPSTIPQDLMLIQDLIGESPRADQDLEKPVDHNDDESIGSTDNESDSEEEEVANLVFKTEETEDSKSNGLGPLRHTSESDSSSESDSGESDTEAVEHGKTSTVNSKLQEFGDYDDDEIGDSLVSAADVKTKNEKLEYDVTIPDISEVGPNEELERVGEIMNITENLVIVQGSPGQNVDRAHQRALDSGTLLVFEDRNVLGYIHETFGPTYQPFYQVRFSQAYPIDLDKVRGLRSVFHVPQRSKFVFLKQLNVFKGSDASNAHDEEPGDDEMEFSDDEQEAAYKHRMKQQRRAGSRAQSLTPSSRHSTPIHSQMHDQDLTVDALYGTNPYDEHGPYDLDSGPSPARAAPLPYDDPYSEAYNFDTTTAQSVDISRSSIERPVIRASESGERRGRGRGWGQGTSSSGRDAASRGGASRRGRQRRDRGRGRARGGMDSSRDLQHQQPYRNLDDPHRPRPSSPTSMAIARATGQYDNGSSSTSQTPYSSEAAISPHINDDSWMYQQHQQASPYQFNYMDPGYQQPYVQPHINPQFASAYGFQFGAMQPGQYTQYGSYGMDMAPGPENGTGGWENYEQPYDPNNT